MVNNLDRKKIGNFFIKMHYFYLKDKPHTENIFDNTLPHHYQQPKKKKKRLNKRATVLVIYKENI